ncbi:hypothetical protein HPB48_017942 [Haemaphysalis longicornis]|uniref:Uncharacterized protein n=1 Tax=Haemaphysalis longicornis TaxID=44386 RepID=A0A9J6GQM5_HAELO|nr:hypothetical protein HPB48_017942 [Haemaphysalis longicornis]
MLRPLRSFLLTCSGVFLAGLRDRQSALDCRGPFLILTGACTDGAGFLLGGLSLALCGQPDLGVRPLLRLPLYHEKYGQRFPFRTLCMLVSFGTLVLGSVLAKFVFSRSWLSQQYDVCYCFRQADAMDQLKPSVQPIESRGGARLAPSAAFLPAGAAPTSDISVHSSNVSDASSRTNMLLAIERVALSVVSPQKTAHKKDFSTNDVRLTNRPSAALSQRALDITGETTAQSENAAPYQRVCKNAVEDDCKTGEPDTTPPAATNTNSTVPPRPDDASPPAVFEATHPDAKGHHVATVRDRTLSDADITLDGNSLLPHYTHTERFSICPQSPHDGSPFHQGLAEHQAYYPSAHNDDLQNDADPPIGIDSLRGVDYVRNPTSTTDSVSRPSDASNAATGASSPAVAAKTEIVGSDNTGPAESIPEFCKDAGSSAVKIKNPVRHRVSGGTEAAEKPGRETSPVAELSSSSSVTSERTSPGRSPSTKRRRHDRSGSGSDAPGSVDDKSAAASDPACHDIVSKTSNGALHNSGLSGSSSTPQEADKATETSQGKKKRSPTARRVAARSRAAGSSSISSLFDEHSTSSTVTTEQSPIRRPRSAKGIKRSKTKGKHQ